jgi:hypothetical protein
MPTKRQGTHHTKGKEILNCQICNWDIYGASWGAGQGAYISISVLQPRVEHQKAVHPQVGAPVPKQVQEGRERQVECGAYIIIYIGCVCAYIN